MEIIRDQIAYTLTPQELQEAAEEWKHLCLMHRIISYLAEYHGIPLTMNLPNQEYKAKLLDFYDTYHIPFESLVKANESSVEELINAPDQVYLFLSSLAQTYELDEGYAGVPEKEGFLVLFQDKKTQSFAREIPTRCIQLGFFTQVSDEMLICDPSVTRSEPEMIVRLSGVELGMWRPRWWRGKRTGRRVGRFRRSCLQNPAPARFLSSKCWSKRSCGLKRRMSLQTRESWAFSTRNTTRTPHPSASLLSLGRTNAGRERAMNLFWSIRMLASSPMVPSPAPGRERVCMMGTC